jgi:hypothetical protein
LAFAAIKQHVSANEKSTNVRNNFMVSPDLKNHTTVWHNLTRLETQGCEWTIIMLCGGTSRRQRGAALSALP